MVRVTGTKGNIVNIEITGIGEVIRRLRMKGIEIRNNAELGIVKAGAFIEDEVKESIIGNRAEPKSVETGRFGNSIQFNKTGNMQGVVKPKRETYPGTSATTEDVAMLMEFSPNISGGPRRHFRNTEKRNEKKVRDIISNKII